MKCPLPHYRTAALRINSSAEVENWQGVTATARPRRGHAAGYFLPWGGCSLDGLPLRPTWPGQRQAAAVVRQAAPPAHSPWESAFRPRRPSGAKRYPSPQNRPARYEVRGDELPLLFLDLEHAAVDRAPQRAAFDHGVDLLPLQFIELMLLQGGLEIRLGDGQVGGGAVDLFLAGMAQVAQNRDFV